MVKKVDANRATKVVTRFMPFVQESTIIRLLHQYPAIVQWKEIGYGTNTITMELYDCNLRSYIFDRKPGDEQILAVLYDILTGLAILYRLGLVHGDIKMGNILVNYRHRDLPIAVIGDLGFTAPTPYAKSELCTRNYRENRITHTWHNDMFSFGIIMIKVFASRKMTHDKKSTDYRYLKKFTNDYVRSDLLGGKIKEAILWCIDAEHRNRRTAIEVGQYIFGDFEIPDVDDRLGSEFLDEQLLKQPFPRSIYDYTKKYLKDLTQRHSIRRLENIHLAVVIYLSSEMENINRGKSEEQKIFTVSEEDIIIAMITVSLIASCCFGYESNFSLTRAIQKIEALGMTPDEMIERLQSCGINADFKKTKNVVINDLVRLEISKFHNCPLALKALFA